MTAVVMIFMLLGCAVAQSLIPPIAALAQAKPPCLLSVVIYYAAMRSRGVMILAAIAAGLLQDALSPVPLGYSPVMFCALGLLIHRFRHVIFDESKMAALFLAGLGGAMATLVMYWILRANDEPSIACPFWWGFVKASGTGLLGVIAGPAIFFLNLRFEQGVGLVAREER